MRLFKSFSEAFDYIPDKTLKSGMIFRAVDIKDSIYLLTSKLVSGSSGYVWQFSLVQVTREDVLHFKLVIEDVKNLENLRILSYELIGQMGV